MRGRKRGRAMRTVRGVRGNRRRFQEWVVIGISSQRVLVCDTLEGQRPRRADHVPGRCWAGEGVAWRHNLTGRLVSFAYFNFMIVSAWAAPSGRRRAFT